MRIKHTYYEVRDNVAWCIQDLACVNKRCSNKETIRVEHPLPTETIPEVENDS